VTGSHYCSYKMKREHLRKYTLSITLAVLMTGFLSLDTMPVNMAQAQAPYIRMKTATVVPHDNATAMASCNDGDGIVSGGYSIGFISAESVFDTMLYSNHPAQELNETGYFEGWEAGIVNKGNETVEISAVSLCLNLTLTP
jgi:hypothetical protein